MQGAFQPSFIQTRTVRGSDFTPALIILQKLFILLNHHFIYLNQIFMYMPAWRKKNGKTEKDMLGELQESSFAM